MKLDGFGIMVDDMAVMVRFYRDVLGFEIKEGYIECFSGKGCDGCRSRGNYGTDDGGVGTENLLYCGPRGESGRNRFV